MYPTLHIGPVTLQTFGLCFALAFLAAGAVVYKRFGELGKPKDWAYEMAFAALIGGIVGSRSSHPPQHRGLGRADQRPAREPGDDADRNALDRYRRPSPRRHRPPGGERSGSGDLSRRARFGYLAQRLRTDQNF